MADEVNIKTAKDVSEWLLTEVERIYDNYFADKDAGTWTSTDFIDRFEERAELINGTKIDLGNDLASPAIRKILRHMRQYKQQDQ